MNDKESKSQKDEQLWFVKANIVLQPLRFHLHELILDIEQYNRFARRMGKALLSKKKVAEARKALARAERFFTKV